MAFIESFPWYPDLLAVASILAARIEDCRTGAVKESAVLKPQDLEPLSRRAGAHVTGRSQELERAPDIQNSQRRGVSLPTLTCKDVEEQLGGTQKAGVPLDPTIGNASRWGGRSKTPIQHSGGLGDPVWPPASPFDALSMSGTAHRQHVSRAAASGGSAGLPGVSADDGGKLTGQKAGHAEANAALGGGSPCRSPAPASAAADLQSNLKTARGDTSSHPGLRGKRQHTQWVEHEAMKAQKTPFEEIRLESSSLHPDLAGLGRQDSTQEPFAAPFQTNPTAFMTAAPPPLPSWGQSVGLQRLRRGKRSGSLGTAEAARASLPGKQTRDQMTPAVPPEAPHQTSKDASARAGLGLEHRSNSLQLSPSEVTGPHGGTGAPRRTSIDCGAGPYTTGTRTPLAGDRNLHAGGPERGRLREVVEGPLPWEREGPAGGTRGDGGDLWEAKVNRPAVVGSSPEATDPHAQLLHMWQAGKSHVTSLQQPLGQANTSKGLNGEPLPFLAWTRMPGLATKGLAQTDRSDSGGTRISETTAAEARDAAPESAIPKEARLPRSSRASEVHAHIACSFLSLGLLPSDTKRRSPSPTQSLSESDVWNVGAEEQGEGNLRSVNSADVQASLAKQAWGFPTALSAGPGGIGAPTFPAGLVGHDSRRKAASQVSALSHALSKCKDADASDIGDGGGAPPLRSHRVASIGQGFPAGDPGRHMHPIGTFRSLAAAGLLCRRASLESD